MAVVRALPSLTPVKRQSLSDAVFKQLHAQIVAGELPAGDPLPSERSLCEALGVNRGSVREALRRLEQARLVSVRHGGTSRVLDYRANAGLDLLAHLLISSAGQLDLAVVRSVMEMRSAIAPDAARWAALRAPEGMIDRIDAVVRQMQSDGTDLGRLQATAVQFWSLLIDAADNIAYRLAYNSLRDIYARCQSLLTQVMQPELSDLASYRGIAEAIRRRNGALAESRAGNLIRMGEESMNRVLAKMESLANQENVR